MDIPFVAVSIIIALLIAVPFYRLIVGPTLFDRVIACGLIGTKSVLLLIVIGFAYGRIEMFIDLAIAYALLNFIGTVATGKYLEKRADK